MDEKLLNMLDAEKRREEKSIEGLIDLVLHDADVATRIVNIQEEIASIEGEYVARDKAGADDKELMVLAMKTAAARERLAELSIEKNHSEQRVRQATEHSKHISGRLTGMRDIALRKKP